MVTLLTNGANASVFLMFNKASGVPSIGNTYGVVGQAVYTAIYTLDKKNINITFKAESNTLFCYAELSGGSNRAIRGDGTKLNTFVTLEEIPNHLITTEWS